MLERTESVLARLEFAHCLYMSELASFHITVAAVAARGHVGMLERAMWVGAVGIEFTLLLILVGTFGSRGGMATHALPVLASCAKRADVRDIHRGVGRGCGGLMSELAIPVGTSQVELAYYRLGVGWL